MFYGIELSIIELSIFYTVSSKLRNTIDNFRRLDSISYYWCMFTILTMIWEVFFITGYTDVIGIANYLYYKKQHTWTTLFDITYILPWKFSHIFYAEYAVYADREYMNRAEDWSRIIEGTHAIFCGLFSLLAMIQLYNNSFKNYKISIACGMSCQLMNSLLYMFNYIIQTKDPNSLNYNTPSFPTGFLLTDRFFMYINIFWTIMPIYLIYKLYGKTRNKYSLLKFTKYKSSSL